MPRPKLSDDAKRARGTYRKDRSNPNAPRPEAIEIGPPPADYPELDAAIWRRLAAVLNPMHIVAATDLPALELTVSAVALAKRTADDPKASANQRIRTSQAALSALGAFGLTPQTRHKVSTVPHAVVGDALAEFLRS